MHILYLSGTLPARSETFVYREIFGLKARGVDITTASVHAPENDLGDNRLTALSEHTIDIYGSGPVRLVLDAMGEGLRHPLRALSTLGLGATDAVAQRDVPLSRRPKILWQCLGGLALAARARRRGISHVHAHMAHVPTSIAMYAARQLGVGFSFTGHAVDLFSQRTMLRAKLRRARFVACISEWHRGFYQSIDPRHDDDLPIVRCGVDTDEFAGTGHDQPEQLHVVAIGRLVNKKGFDLLLGAVAAAIGDGRHLKCTIGGDGPERKRLESLAHELDLADAVSFTGNLTNTEARDLMRSADIFALPCRVDSTGDRDGIPVVLMEAMACSVPVISGDLPTIRELVAHDSTGLLVDSGDDSSVVNALARLCDDPDLRTALGRAGRQRVLEEFSQEANVTRILHAFQRVSPSLCSSSNHLLEAARTARAGSTMPRRYVLITPCRDEAAHLQRTIDSVADQTVPPVKWVIVDDGSTDDTPNILAEAAARHPFIQVVQNPDRGNRAVGPGVIEAFYAGLEHVDLDACDFLCKLDADLEFEPVYFKHLMERFESDPWLGNMSGKTYVEENGQWHSERLGDENAIGAAKFYRVACFREIGGFAREVSWDGLDGHMCRMKGWVAQSHDVRELRIRHLRRMGSSHRGLWTGRLRWGMGKWYMGSSLIYVTAVAAYRMLERPYVMGGVGILAGYLRAMLTRRPRHENVALRRFLRKYELRSLLFGKRRVMNATHDRIRAEVPARDRTEPDCATLTYPAPPSAKAG